MMKKLFTIWMIALALFGQAFAQEPTELIVIADAYGEALNTHDLDTIMSYWTDDAVYNYAPLPTPFEGKEAVRAFFGALFVGFPDFATTEGRTLAANNIVVVEHGLDGTHQGEWMGVPPTGNAVSLPHIDIYEFEGDKIKRAASYLDATSVMIQLGVVPTPDMPTLVPSFTLPDAEPTGLSPMEADVEHMN